MRKLEENISSELKSQLLYNCLKIKPQKWIISIKYLKSSIEGKKKKTDKDPITTRVKWKG